MVHITIKAPPNRVATCAKGIKFILLAVESIATSPVPPIPLWQDEIIDASTGYIFKKKLQTNPVIETVKTIEIMVIKYGIVNTLTTLFKSI